MFNSSRFLNNRKQCSSMETEKGAEALNLKSKTNILNLRLGVPLRNNLCNLGRALGFHSRDETAMSVYKTMAKCGLRFA